MARPDPADKQIHLTAQAEAEDSVEERGDEADRGGRHAQGGHPGPVTDNSDNANQQPDGLREPGRHLGWGDHRTGCSTDGSPYGDLPMPRKAPAAKTSACAAS